VSVESDVRDATVTDDERDTNKIATGRPTGTADKGAARNAPAPRGLAQMLLEGMHPTEDRRPVGRGPVAKHHGLMSPCNTRPGRFRVPTTEVGGKCCAPRNKNHPPEVWAATDVGGYR